MLGATNQKKKRKRKYVSLSSGACVCVPNWTLRVFFYYCCCCCLIISTRKATTTKRAKKKEKLFRKAQINDGYMTLKESGVLNLKYKTTTKTMF